MDMAELTASLSYATRLQVGALIVKGNRVIGTGYNGMPTDWENDCEVKGATKPEVLHAESNAITKLAKSTQSSLGSTMYITISPCVECAKLIIQAGIKRVVYKDLYRNDAGIRLLNRADIVVDTL